MKRTKGQLLLVTMLLCCLLLLLTLPEVVWAANEKTVALVMKDLANPFWLKVDQGAREYAAKYNISLEVFGIERETHFEHQINIMENLISRGYGAIVVAPSDSKKLVPVCKKAQAQGIKIINIDNPFDQETLDRLGVTFPFIGPDNFSGGELVGNYVRAKLKGKGQVLVIEGTPGVSNSDKRKNGFIRGVSQNSAIQLARVVTGNWHREEAFSVAFKALEEMGRVDAVFCTNDVMALGALQALDLFALSGEVIVTGYDNIDLVRTEMRNGRIHATVEQNPEIMGAYGVEAAWKSLNGLPVAEEINTPVDLISADHMDKKLVVSVADRAEPFFAELLAGVEEQAELFGMQLTILSAGNQHSKQAAQIMASLEGHPDILVIHPSDRKALQPVLEKVSSRNIPVITLFGGKPSSSVLSNLSMSQNSEQQTPEIVGTRVVQTVIRYFRGEEIPRESSIEVKLTEK